MNSLIEVLKSLNKRKVGTILLIVQYIIGFSALFSCVTYYNSINEFSKTFRSITDTDKVSIMYNPTGIEPYSIEKTEPDYESFYDYIKENKDIKNYGTYAYSSKLLVVDKLNSSDKFNLVTEIYNFNKVDTKTIAADLKNVGVNLVTIDEGFNNFIKFELDEGEALTSEDFNKNENDRRNILLGSNYKKYYKVGDIITLQTDKSEEFRVSGFIKDSTYFYNQGGVITSSLMNLGSTIVVPINKIEENDKQLFKSRIMNGLLIKFNDGVKPESAIEKINTKAEEMGLGGRAQSLNSILKAIVDGFIRSNIPQLVIGVFFCIFASIALITSLIVTIHMKKREIGIRIAYGASTFNIFNTVFLEVILVCITSFVVAIFQFIHEKGGSLQLQKKQYAYFNIIDIYGNVDIYALCQLFVVVIIILLISSFIILRQVKKLQPKDLIGGLE